MLRRNLILSIASLALPRAARALNLRPTLYVQVCESALKMRITTVDGARYECDVSMGMDGHKTPVGRFGVVRLDRNHKSTQYPVKWNQKLHRFVKGGAPMPYSIFFAPGCAIHGGSVYNESHGCIHLRLQNSARLFELVERYGKENTLIDIYPA